MINVLIIIMSVLVVVCFILGVVGVLVEKKKGKDYIGQGYGRK